MIKRIKKNHLTRLLQILYEIEFYGGEVKIKSERPSVKK